MVEGAAPDSNTGPMSPVDNLTFQEHDFLEVLIQIFGNSSGIFDWTVLLLYIFIAKYSRELLDFSGSLNNLEKFFEFLLIRFLNEI